jgi:hypothetical protein
LANRSLIALTAWSCFVHAALTGWQAFRNLVERGVAALIIIGVALIVLAPAKSVEPVSAIVV